LKNCVTDTFSFSQELAAEKVAFEESTRKLFELKEQQQTSLPQELSAQRQALIATQQEIDKQRRLFDDVNKEKEYKTTELTLGRDFYRKYLALDFQRVDDNRLRFVFTHIDPANHERQFIFSVFVNSANTYELVECEPRLANVAALVADLNADNNFSRFVQRMRAQFRAVALH
jgi:kinetochore protein Spc25